MSHDTVPFRAILACAEEQLQWGVEPEALEDAARAVSRRLPGSLVADQLMGRAAELRTALARLPRHTPTAAPASSPPAPPPASSAEDAPGAAA